MRTLLLVCLLCLASLTACAPTSTLTTAERQRQAIARVDSARASRGLPTLTEMQRGAPSAQATLAASLVADSVSNAEIQAQLDAIALDARRARNASEIHLGLTVGMFVVAVIFWVTADDGSD